MKSVWIVGCAGRAPEARDAAEGGARACDAVELRLDLLEADGMGEAESMEIAARIAAGGRRVLATRRRREEGGAWDGEGDGDWAERWGVRGADVDLELRGAGAEERIRRLAQRGVRVVASVHEPGRWPERRELETWEAAARRSGAAVLKVAGRLEGEAELTAAEAWLGAKRAEGLEVCAMGVGRGTAGSGAEARTRLARAGGCAVYGALGAGTAEGQPSCAELARALGRAEGERVRRVERRDVLGIRFVCGRCGQHLEAGREDFGRELACPACGQRLQAPDLKDMPRSFAVKRRR